MQKLSQLKPRQPFKPFTYSERFPELLEQHRKNIMDGEDNE